MARVRKSNKSITLTFKSAGKDIGIIGKGKAGRLDWSQVIAPKALDEVIQSAVKHFTKRFASVIVACSVQGSTFYGRNKFTLGAGGLSQTKLKAVARKKAAKAEAESKVAKPKAKKDASKKTTKAAAKTAKPKTTRAKKAATVHAVAADAASIVAYATPTTSAKPKAKPKAKKAAEPKAAKGGRKVSPKAKAGLARYQKFIAAQKAGGKTHKQAMAAWKRENK